MIVVHTALRSVCICLVVLHFWLSQSKMLQPLLHTCVSQVSLYNAHHLSERKDLDGTMVFSESLHCLSLCSLSSSPELRGSTSALS